MTNLSKNLREKLNEQFEIRPIAQDLIQKGSDGTVKVRFKTYDGHLIEGVLIPTEFRITACISSQSGCSLRCRFCATGFLELERNLDAAEIYDQVAMLNQIALKNFERPLSNIVYMGMGEPLLNYGNVVHSIHLLTDETGLDMSPRRLTISTAGVVKAIKRLSEEKLKVNLALSLHAVTNETRNEIMEINRSNPIEDLISSLSIYHLKTKSKVSFEYILFEELNDSIEDAAALARLSRQVPAFVNLIEYNTIEKVSYKKSGTKRRERFISYLESQGVTAKFRVSRGRDIDAACGQLANKQNAATILNH